jgi:hypothetical protein
MHQKTKDIQKRYDGFLQTPSLWKTNTVLDLQQFEIYKKSSKINIDIDEKLRLGKYIERFVSYQLKQESDVSILCENVQIQQNNRTLGELDCIIKKGKKIVHLEIIYKFYIYDENVGTTEIEHCIGPNRKDSLIEKLNKLKQKQLPLLYSKECEVYLKNFQLSSIDIIQQVYFKAQLFVPYHQKNKNLSILNANCIAGFYCNESEMEKFTNYKFYIPVKKDWLVIPNTNVNWLNYHQFKEKFDGYLSRKFSPLCWLKNSNGELIKMFFVWW